MRLSITQLKLWHAAFFGCTLKLDFYLCTLLLMVGVDQGLGYVHRGLLQLCGVTRISFETCTWLLHNFALMTVQKNAFF